MSMKLNSRVLAIAITGSLIAASCTGGASPRPSPSEIAASTLAPITQKCAQTGLPPHGGGSVVFGAEQWPDCLNPITACAASNWTHFTVLEHVLPRAMQLDPNGNFVPSPLLVEAPSLANGGLAQNPFTVTYRISEVARWEDGSPIISADFAFTWRAILNTAGAYDTKGYDRISSIDSEDPHTAVVTFDDVYIDWPDLFGGVRGFVLKQAAFPKVDPNTPDLSQEMLKGIPFSGGPYLLTSWSKQQAVLVCNSAYYGPQARIDQLTFVARTDQDKEIQSLLTGEVAAIYPDVSGVIGPFRQIDAPPLKIVSGDGTYVETLWFDQTTPPLNDPIVREALMYAIDRQALIDVIAKLNNPDADALNCGLLVLPNQGPWCETKPFAQFTYDPERAKSILQADGYDCSSSPCSKNGEALVIEYAREAAGTRQRTTQELLIAPALVAGFELKPYVAGSGGTLGDVCPYPFHGIVDCATPVTPDPSVTASFGCGAGNNAIGWCDPEADALMAASDRELDPAKRLELMGELYALEARDFVSLPLYVLPAVSAWRTDQLAGPFGLYNSSPYGFFFNMNDWYVASA
jgi:peptide/nickel transport system substrate-binding protein